MTTDPLLSLHEPIVPRSPSATFAEALRARIERALNPTNTERNETMETATKTAPIIAYLCVRDAPRAIAWYVETFGAIETLRYVGDDQRVGHAELDIGGHSLYLADEFPEIGVVSPQTLGGTSVALTLEVADVDYTYRRSVDNGAVGQRAPADQNHGNRTATILDPFGHRWMLSKPIENLDAATLDGREDAWTVTGRKPVEPGYITMLTADVARAGRFFGELFGWELEPNGHIGNTRFPMGFAPTGQTSPTQSPGDDNQDDDVTVYFRVDKIESYAARVVELGGQVLSRADYPSGGNARCLDDQGLRFDLFRPAPGY